MGRTPKLSLALWTTVVSVSAACGSSDKVGQLADAPPELPDDAQSDAQNDAQSDAHVDAPANAPIAVVPSSLTAAAECGVATPEAAQLTISNTGKSDLVIQAATADNGFAVSTTLPVTVAAGAELTLAIVPPASVIGTDRGGTTKTGTLTLTTNEPTDALHTVALVANVLGANIDFTDQTGTALALFLTGSSGLCPAPETVFLRNSGTETVMIGAGVASGFSVSGFSGGTLAPGAMVSQDIRLSTQGPCVGSGAVVYQVTGTVCSAPNATLVGAFNISGASSCFCS